MLKLNRNNVERFLQDDFKDNPERVRGLLRSQQIAVYVMCGGGMIGRFAAEQPADFYIDDRVGRLPYSRRAIAQAVDVLVMMAKVCGYSGRSDMPKMSDLHGSGIW